MPQVVKPFGYLTQSVFDDLVAAFNHYRATVGLPDSRTAPVVSLHLGRCLPLDIASMIDNEGGARIRSFFELLSHTDPIVRGLAWWELAEAWRTKTAADHQQEILEEHLRRVCQIGDAAALQSALPIWLDGLLMTVDQLVLNCSKTGQGSFDVLSSPTDLRTMVLMDSLCKKTVTPITLLNDASPVVRLIALAYLASHITVAGNYLEQISTMIQCDPSQAVRAMAARLMAAVEAGK